MALNAKEPINERDHAGRFITGAKPGPGRPKGSRPAIAESFLRDALVAWEKHGAAALEMCAVTDPSRFCQIISNLLPRESRLDVDVDIELRATNALEAFRIMKGLSAPERRQLVIEHAATPTDD